MTETDQRHLIAAQGWRELGLLGEAFDELEGNEPQNRAHPDVLKMRRSVYCAAEKWAEAIEFAL